MMFVLLMLSPLMDVKDFFINDYNFVASKKVTQTIKDNYLPFKMSEDRMRYIQDVLKEEGQINTDARPIAYFYDILLWSSQFNTVFKKVFLRLQHVPRGYFFLLPVLIFVLGFILKKFFQTSVLTLSVMTTGFSEIIFQIIIVLAFQSLYGYAYYKIGLIVASFMCGLVIGSFTAITLIKRCSQKVFSIYKCVQGGIMLYPLILPGLFILFRNIESAKNSEFLFASVFASLPVIAGFMGGMQYPLAVFIQKEILGQDGEITVLAGLTYSADVFGAMLGALLTATILVPLLGINTLAYLCAAINCAVLILLLLTKENRPQMS